MNCVLFLPPYPSTSCILSPYPSLFGCCLLLQSISFLVSPTLSIFICFSIRPPPASSHCPPLSPIHTLSFSSLSSDHRCLLIPCLMQVPSCPFSSLKLLVHVSCFLFHCTSSRFVSSFLWPLVVPVSSCLFLLIPFCLLRYLLLYVVLSVSCPFCLLFICLPKLSCLLSPPPGVSPPSLDPWYFLSLPLSVSFSLSLWSVILCFLLFCLFPLYLSPEVSPFVLRHFRAVPVCAAKAFYYCPSMISHRPRSQNISKERALSLSLTGVGPFGPSLLHMQIPLNVLKVSYRQKIGIPQAVS